MSDLFHEEIPFEFIRRVFDTMINASQHVFQILTKRSEILIDYAPLLPWTDNIWMGVSVESEDYKFRIDSLRKTPARVKFLSIEPLLGRLRKTNFKGIDWVIVGGESGPKARMMHPDWVREIRDTCVSQDTPFFFKQWGGINKKKTGRELDGEYWDQMPKLFSSHISAA